MTFRCQQFTVEDGNSTMAVGTDAMLLGSWADPGDARTILDIGTGCGILALMMAQESGARIEAIDVDARSVEEAAANFRASPWSHRLQATRASVADLTGRPQVKFGMIISNPPFYSGSLRSPHHRRNLARHDTGLDLPGLISGAGRLLEDSGRLFMVVPAQSRVRLVTLAAESELYPFGFLSVRPTESKEVTRLLAGFSRLPGPGPEEQQLTICGTDGKFTAEYLALTHNFHYF